MLRLNLNRLFEERGIENPTLYFRKNGFSLHTTHRILNQQVDSISYKNLEKICLLLNCTIDDIFQWYPSDSLDLKQNHALQKLIRGSNPGMLTNKLKKLPMHKIEEVRKFIEQLENKEDNE